MAKAKAKKSSGKSKSGVTKRLPKAVRKSGLVQLLDSDLGRKVLADALIAAAGAAAAALTQTRPVRKAGAAVADAGADAAGATKDTALDAADAVAGIVTEAARHFLPASLLGATDEASDGGKSGRKKVKYAAKSSSPSKSKSAKAKNGGKDKAVKH